MNKSFETYWQYFISLSKPGLYAEDDRAIALCFYTKGWLDATTLLIMPPARPAKLEV